MTIPVREPPGIKRIYGLKGIITMSKYDVNNIAVSSLLASIKNGEIAIPEIQCPFVWDNSKVRDLIDSLYQNIPIRIIGDWVSLQSYWTEW